MRCGAGGALVSHPHGKHLGGIRTLDELRERCVMDGDCWVCRTRCVWLYGTGAMTARCASLRLRGEALREGYVVARTCDTEQCVRHVKQVPRASAVRAATKAGVMRTTRKAIANRVAGAKRSRVTPEVWRWAMESGQSNKDIAHALGVSHSLVSAKRAKATRATLW